LPVQKTQHQLTKATSDRQCAIISSQHRHQAKRSAVGQRRQKRTDPLSEKSERSAVGSHLLTRSPCGIPVSRLSGGSKCGSRTWFIIPQSRHRPRLITEAPKPNLHIVKKWDRRPLPSDFFLEALPRFDEHRTGFLLISRRSRHPARLITMARSPNLQTVKKRDRPSFGRPLPYHVHPSSCLMPRRAPDGTGRSHHGEQSACRDLKLTLRDCPISEVRPPCGSRIRRPFRRAGVGGASTGSWPT
jgi:hypothetical protein